MARDLKLLNFNTSCMMLLVISNLFTMKKFKVGLSTLLSVSIMAAASAPAFADENPFDSNGVPFDFDVSIGNSDFRLKDIPQVNKDYYGHIFLGTYESGTKLTFSPNRTPGDEDFIYEVSLYSCDNQLEEDYWPPNFVDLDTLELIEEWQGDEREPVDIHPLYRSEDFSDLKTDYTGGSYKTFDVPTEFTLYEQGCNKIGIDVREDERYSNKKRYFSFVVLTDDGPGDINPNIQVVKGEENNPQLLDVLKEYGDDATTFFGPDTVTIKDTSDVKGLKVAKREWSVSWMGYNYDVGARSSNIYKGPNDKEIELELKSPGSYMVNLKLTDENGGTYTAQTSVNTPPVREYLSRIIYRIDDPFDAYLHDEAPAKTYTDEDGNKTVLETRPAEGPKDESAVLDHISTLSSEKREIMERLFNECEFNVDAENTIACSDEMDDLIKAYNENYKEVKFYCDHFPDLKNYKADQLICPAARALKDRKIFEGDGASSDTAGFLRPNEEINRIEICAVLNKSKISSVGKTVPGEVADTKFSDLKNFSASDWRKTNASVCNEFGGYDDGTFRPSANIKLAEVLKVLFLLYGEKEAENVAGELPNFCPDLRADTWYSGYLALAHKKGFLDEVDRNCDPGKEVTRGDVVKVMYLMFKDYLYISPP
jgi:hypothetical protein